LDAVELVIFQRGVLDDYMAAWIRRTGVVTAWN